MPLTDIVALGVTVLTGLAKTFENFKSTVGVSSPHVKYRSQRWK